MPPNTGHRSIDAISISGTGTSIPDTPLPARRVLGHRPEPHLRPVRLELFGEDHREPGLRSLAHFRLVHGQGDDVVRADAQPGVGGEVGVYGVRRRTAARGQIEGDDEAGARLDEFAAGAVAAPSVPPRGANGSRPRL